MCDEEAIDFEADSINQDTYKAGEEFEVKLKVRDLPLLLFPRATDAHAARCLDQSTCRGRNQMCHRSRGESETMG